MIYSWKAVADQNLILLPPVVLMKIDKLRTKNVAKTRKKDFLDEKHGRNTIYKFMMKL